MNLTRSRISMLVATSFATLLALPLAVPATVNCPDGMARIGDAYCIDRWEASLVEIQPDGTETPYSPYHAPDGVRVRAQTRPGVVPQGYINERSAAQACQAAGKRLCSNPEWTRACRGPNHTQFPYGEARESHRCNDDHTRHPIVQLYAHSRLYVWGHATMNDPQLNQLPGTLALTGAFSGCTNDYGVYDMVGNLHEWIGDARGTFRGGYYMDDRLNGDGCSYTTSAHDVSYHDYSTGFRCCADLPGET